MSVRCPRCHESIIRRSQRKQFERYLSILRLVPYRCLSCNLRFFWFREKGVIASGEAH